jgi:uncharacterized Zn finger protein (UPF0148 family)
MSEDFDKEAEREKLREKYEQDKQKRQATEQMSELLLQGATMTNAHCSDCSDPVFRYEGQEFCPTCEKPVDRATEEADDEDEDSESIQVTTPSDNARVSFGGEGQASPEGGQPTPSDGAGTEPTEQSAEANRQQPAADHRVATGESVENSRQRARKQPQRQPTGGEQMAAGEANVTAAREALVQTLTRFSQQAAATDDPNRAQEHLAAAHEAADALAALRQ